MARKGLHAFNTDTLFFKFVDLFIYLNVRVIERKGQRNHLLTDPFPRLQKQAELCLAKTRSQELHLEGWQRPKHLCHFPLL